MKKKMILLSLVFMLGVSSSVSARPHSHEHNKFGCHPVRVKPVHHCKHHNYPRLGFFITTGSFRYHPGYAYYPYMIVPHGAYYSYPVYSSPNLYFNIGF